MIVQISPDQLSNMIRQELDRRDINNKALAVQIVVEQPFGNGMLVHNEVPWLRVLVSADPTGN